MIDKNRLLKTLIALIKIRSENPSGNEKEIAGWVHSYLKDIGISSKIVEVARARSNVIARVKGTSSRSLLITPHLDTVPAGKGWTLDPFSGIVKNGKIYGLGATDCKGNLAVALEVLRSLGEDRIHLGYDLVFAATADEESGSSSGIVPLVKKGMLDADAAVILDSDDFEVVVAQKGLVQLKITTKGKRAHGAYPWLGTNAISRMNDFLSKAREYKFRGVKKNRLLRPPTLNIGTIRGGDKVNIVPDRCEAELDIRYVPGMSPEKIVSDMKKIAAVEGRGAYVEIEGSQSPFEIDPGHCLVKSYRSAARSLGKRSKVRGSEGATVITYFQERGIPAFATGYGKSGVAHMSDEYAVVADLYDGARVLERFLRTLDIERIQQKR